MPRFFVDTFDGIAVFDDEGYDLPNRDAVKDLVKRTLSGLMCEEKIGPDPTRLKVNVRDESGAQIMTASLVMRFDDYGSVS